MVIPDHEERLARLERLAKPGRENTFTLAWGRLLAAYVQQRWVLLTLLIALLVSVSANAVLAVRYSKRETWVFVRDRLGNVVQADPSTFLRAGEGRDEMEIKAFARQWCEDSFHFTPLDVKDRVIRSLRFVEPKAQSTARFAMRFLERAQQVEQGLTVNIEDEPEKGKVPEVNILRADPLEVLVVFSRVSIQPGGEVKPLPPLGVKLQMREVPRSPANGHGLLITDVSSSNQ